jgi:hypothetical protein
MLRESDGRQMTSANMPREQGVHVNGVRGKFIQSRNHLLSPLIMDENYDYLSSVLMSKSMSVTDRTTTFVNSKSLGGIESICGESRVRTSASSSNNWHF